MEIQKQQLETPEGTLGYTVTDNRIIITDYSGMDVELCIPGRVENLQVESLQKKAFLSRKHLRKIMLPDMLEEIGDWAFAYCTNLECVWLPRKKMKIGNRIFMECPGIKKIYVYELENAQEAESTRGIGQAAEQTASLLAASSSMLDAEYLMEPAEAGTVMWLHKWDARMKEAMSTEDSDGYTRMILCGEEDFGSNIDDFIRNKRKGKARLAFLRLLNPLGLPQQTAKELREYLLTHTKGCESEEAWEVLLEEHGYEQEYFELFAESGGINDNNFDAILMDMSGEYAEMKAFLISYREEKMGRRDFFGGLSLDNL